MASHAYTQQMELNVIIVNWNAADDTIRCVHQLQAWEQLSPQIIIVDNASTDNSLACIIEANLGIYLIRSRENLGFAGGTNLGIKAALQQGNAPILLLNNDAFIREADMLRLIKTLQECPQIGVIGPLLFGSEQEEDLIAAGGKNPVLHHRTRFLEIPDGTPIFPVDYVIGAAALIRAEVFKDIGLLDEDYFFSIEVADLCKRARQQGYAVATDSRARAFHELSRSSKFRDTLYVYYSIRNRFIYIRKFYKASRIFLISFWGLYSLALSAKLWITGKPLTARSVYLGLVDGLRHCYGGQNERVLAYIEG